MKPFDTCLCSHPDENTQAIHISGELGSHVFLFSVWFQLLFNLIVDHLADFSAAPDVFAMFAEQLKKTYFNILIKPEKLGKYVRHLNMASIALKHNVFI